MQILKVNKDKPEEDVIEKAAKVLQMGGLVAYPTETVYGLGANIMSFSSIEQIFQVKGRNSRKPISIAFKDVEQAEKYAHFNKAARKLAELFLPGPLTLILHAKVPLGEMFGGDKISIRISSNKVLNSILEKVRFPITATSANKSGRADPFSAEDVLDHIGEHVDLILDSGKLDHGKPSTVLDLSGGDIVVIREGAIPVKRIRKFLRN